MSQRARPHLRGTTLIDLMIAIAIVGIFGHVLMSSLGTYQNTNAIFREDEAVAWVLDAELARAASCPDTRCLSALITKTATTTHLSSEAASWSRAMVHRTATPLGGGRWRFDVRAKLPHLRRPHAASTIVRLGS